jgi:hypothetical protein
VLITLVKCRCNRKQEPRSDPADELPIDPTKDMPAHSLSTNATLAPDKPGIAMVDARSDIYSATLANADPDRGGVLPSKVTLATNTGVIEFHAIAGRSGCVREANYGPDGGACVGGDTAIDAAGGISGIVAHDRSLFLVGVFIAGKPPEQPPPSLDFTAKARGISFVELAPELGQVFFVGDGLTGAGSGSRQRFRVPTGATHLYLGFADADTFQGRPGQYSDNSGGLRVTVVQH